MPNYPVVMHDPLNPTALVSSLDRAFTMLDEARDWAKLVPVDHPKAESAGKVAKEIEGKLAALLDVLRIVAK